MRGSRSSDASVQARREAVLEHVLEAGECTIADLARRFAVSGMTMHRDLDALAAAGYLRKQRGRAVAPSELTVETSALFRLRTATAVKEAVAARAVDLVDDVRTVFVDDSTSVLPLLRLLTRRAHGPLTVLTNYLQVVREVDGAPRVQVHLLGGDYDPHLDATFGPAALEAVRRQRVDVALLSSPAVRQGTCYHALEPSAELKLAALDVADRSVLLLDHTKLGRGASHEVCSVDRFSHVVVDDAADPTEVAAARATGADVRVVHAPAHVQPHPAGPDGTRTPRRSR
ncbi:DeoR/GlpR family DNA-binding transcription regulator [Thalassiella azotivora]